MAKLEDSFSPLSATGTAAPAVAASAVSRQVVGSRAGPLPSSQIRGRPSCTGACVTEADQAIGTRSAGVVALLATISSARAADVIHPRDNTKLPISNLLMSPLSLPRRHRTIQGERAGSVRCFSLCGQGRTPGGKIVRAVSLLSSHSVEIRALKHRFPRSAPAREHRVSRVYLRTRTLSLTSRVAAATEPPGTFRTLPSSSRSPVLPADLLLRQIA